MCCSGPAFYNKTPFPQRKKYSSQLYMFLAFLVKKTSGILILAQAFANLHGKRRQGKFI